MSHTTLKLSSVGNDVVSWCKIQFSTGIPEITRWHNLLSRTLIFLGEYPISVRNRGYTLIFLIFKEEVSDILRIEESARTVALCHYY